MHTRKLNAIGRIKFPNPIVSAKILRKLNGISKVEILQNIQRVR